MSEHETTEGPAVEASRRDLLKLSGATALGAAGFWAAASAVSSGVADATTVPLRIPTSVVLVVAGKTSRQVSRVSQIEELALITTTNSSGDAVTTRVTPGVVRLRLTRSWSSDKTFTSWYSAAQAGTDKPMPVSVKILGKTGSLICQLSMSDAMPLSYKGPTFDKSMPGAHATERLELVAETWQFN